MNIQKIKLKNFRNYENQEIALTPGINVFYGDNGMGKTNILEAISITAIGKSFRTHKEKELIKFGEEFSNIEVNFTKENTESKIKINITNKKDIYVNDIKMKKVSDILGKINIVLFTPDDIDILRKGPRNKKKIFRYDDMQPKTNICI